MPVIIVPTPIGNLDDMTLRGIKELERADVIACEDTRRTLQLLNHLGIKKQLISYHEHNEKMRTEEIIHRLNRGERVAVVSDAGTPGLSDPGAVLVHEAAKRGYEVDVLPGANALLPALLLSGLDMTSFIFVGFLEGRTEEKRKRLNSIKNLPDTLVFYLSPHKLLKDLSFIAEILGERNISLVREISKIHQEVIHGTLLTLCDTISEEKIRGEFVCVIEGADTSHANADETVWKNEVETLCRSGVSVKDTASEIAEKYGVQKNAVKKYILEKLS
ncbi:MAG: 16S rRNA (cytidine(1402)-2'-O)-methyltransferase [Synergistes sp.]|nr:16S rRNA (cytidine(1402)-2'-O)-methyltransferase [Synergistes sp.]